MRVRACAALAVAAAEMLEFGPAYMAQIVRNAQALGGALAQRGIPVFGAHKGYTRTHQVLADVRAFGVGLDVASRLSGSGLQGIADRLAALDGEIEILSMPGAGTTVAGVLPVSEGGAPPS